MQCWHIHINGRVQGVGFRPFVYRLAQAFHLRGEVSNAMDGVHIYANADEEVLQQFCQQIHGTAPAMAHISQMRFEQVAWRDFADFKIVPSQSQGSPNLLITPDLAMCPSCRKELDDPENRRFHYPFITCTNCGPRYSIMQSLPFDRENTSMLPFKMCAACTEEYTTVDQVTEPTGIRYHAQTNSCPTCSINLQLHDLGDTLSYTPPTAKHTTTKVVEQVAELILAGSIVAIKGIGGYLLMADATQEGSVIRLRALKQRPAKPFAVMYPSLAAARQDVRISSTEAKELASYRAPVVLLKLRKVQQSGIASQQVAPGLSKLGVMLPYTPLFYLIAQAVSKPMIATSANLSGSPIIFQDQKAIEKLSSIADYVLSNDREICLPQDDSVVQFSQGLAQPVIIRRSRGLAPAYQPTLPQALLNQDCLAMGAQQKSSIALSAHGQLYISQYLGDLSSYPSTVAYQKTLDYFLNLCRAKPKQIVVDLHPDYYATQLGQQMAQEQGITITHVQHHQAHFGSVLAENKLLGSKTPVLGVVWDGTGLGNDRQVWGGEFFTFADSSMTRTSHLAYTPHRFGDKSANEPRLALFNRVSGDPAFNAVLKAKFHPNELRLYQKLASKPAAQQTSSMGRLFDAVASLLGLGDFNQYESHATILLEQHAAAYLEQNDLPLAAGYPFATHKGKIKPPLYAMLADLQKGDNSQSIAARFHLGLVGLVKEVADEQHISQIAFSGGVFQNALLIDLLITHLSTEYTLYFHQQLSPNDESLPLGQLACHWLSQQPRQKEKNVQPETLNIQ